MLAKARKRTKTLFAERIAAGDNVTQAKAATIKQLKNEFGGIGWVALLAQLMPVILQLIAAFKK